MEKVGNTSCGIFDVGRARQGLTWLVIKEILRTSTSLEGGLICAVGRRIIINPEGLDLRFLKVQE